MSLTRPKTTKEQIEPCDNKINKKLNSIVKCICQGGGFLCTQISRPTLKTSILKLRAGRGSSPGQHRQRTLRTLEAQPLIPRKWTPSTAKSDPPPPLPPPPHTEPGGGPGYRWAWLKHKTRLHVNTTSRSVELQQTTEKDVCSGGRSLLFNA